VISELVLVLAVGSGGLACNRPVEFLSNDAKAKIVVACRPVGDTLEYSVRIAGGMKREVASLDLDFLGDVEVVARAEGWDSTTTRTGEAVRVSLKSTHSRRGSEDSRFILKAKGALACSGALSFRPAPGIDAIVDGSVWGCVA
jgi:hypothetical protein